MSPRGSFHKKMIDLQKKKSGSHFLYDLSVHWADIFVNPLPFKFVPFKL